MSSLEYELKHCEGSDCNCAAQAYFECVCDADWRVKREITLEWKIEKLEATNKEMLSALERLANPKSFDIPRVATREEILRMEYAEKAITSAKQVMRDSDDI